ncbi:hypothetical protein MBGDC06_00087 [Thermoplasmatales archaeon SCGC AB-539-C06]|nr:hypothetical protein MBGDC06_00087 [Thermoplasmatales archaeon SCGC AB-539-C06]
MDVISLIIGFAIGMIVVGIAIELGTKRTTGTAPASRYAKKWSISEIANPRIMAEHMGDIEIPKNSKVLVNVYKDKEILKGLEVKEHGKIKGNFIIGDDRALILAGPVKKDEVGFWTIEKEIVKKLNDEFEEMWTKGTRMIEQEK